MLQAKVLNESATLNSFNFISSLQFIQGETVTLVFQIFQPEEPNTIRFVCPSTALVTAYLPQNDHTDLVKSMTAFTLDRSIWSVTLSNTDTAKLVSGNIRFTVDLLGDGSQIVRGVILNGLALNIVDWNC